MLTIDSFVYNIIIIVVSYKGARSKLRNVSLIAVFGLVLFSAVPRSLDSASTNLRF